MEGSDAADGMTPAGLAQVGHAGVSAQDDPLTAPDHERFGLPDFDLARLAANLRGVMPRVDEEARERLEHAWVAILNAIKQPKVDAVRLASRLSRLADELEALRTRVSRDEQPPADGAASAEAEATATE